jgi:peptide/nickel transport system substrate-binding protein
LGRFATINHAPFNALPVGLGPFRVTRWQRGDRIEMKANPYFWRGRPKLDRITFALIPSRDALMVALRAGEVDLWPLVPPTYVPQLAALPGITVTSTPSLRTTHLDFLMSPGAIADRAVRRAVRFAIDRPAILRTVEHGEGFLTDVIVWPYHRVTADDPHLIGMDPARARRELLAAGWLPEPDGIRAKGGRRLTLHMPYQSGAPELDSIVELLRVQLRAVGIELVSRTYPHSLLFAPPADGGILATGKFDMAVYSSTLTNVPDLASNFDCAQIPPHGENYFRWCDARINPILDAMRQAYDEPAIDRAYDALDAIFIDEVPSIQLFVWRGGYAMSQRVHGYAPNALSSFDDMRDVDVTPR